MHASMGCRISGCQIPIPFQAWFHPARLMPGHFLIVESKSLRALQRIAAINDAMASPAAHADAQQLGDSLLARQACILDAELDLTSPPRIVQHDSECSFFCAHALLKKVC